MGMHKQIKERYQVFILGWIAYINITFYKFEITTYFFNFDNYNTILTIFAIKTHNFCGQAIEYDASHIYTHVNKEKNENWKKYIVIVFLWTSLGKKAKVHLNIYYTG